MERVGDHDRDPSFVLEAETSLTNSELQTLVEAYNKEKNSGPIRAQTKFDYAWALVRSKSKDDQQLGIQLLHEIYKEHPARRRECLYYLALGEFKLGNYRDSRKFNETLLQMEPRNSQALHLRRLIDEKVRSEGLVGMAIVGGAIATLGILTAALLGKGK
ncbi:mitochondrial membrane protein [Chytridiales sp. JEL 0842]|nr:mitochondrial membrane protein [Chytridiales sp. JEL 0842]